MDLTHWHVKLAAWTHDPAEKALVLLRDPAGHEGGTVAAIQEALFGRTGIPSGLRAHIKRADHWAAAADRPQWPRVSGDGPYAPWTQVRFTERPVLIHPLSGEEYDLGALDEVQAQHVKAISTDHLLDWVVADEEGAVDARRTALAFWRFAPDAPAPDLGALWSLLPADTRVPDHTIWAHLDLTSAFATAFQTDSDANPALLTLSLGPVQDFIAQARTTSDLWAGSHLLSRLAWEALKVVCEDLGPDSILLPQLRAVPQVDRWLRDEVGLPSEWFADLEWVKSKTDANPLFAAALPNRFVALVPASRVESLAQEIERRVRAWVQDQANVALDQLLRRSGIDDAATARRQIADQLEGFPEVHWSAVPWAPLLQERDGQSPDTAGLEAVLGSFYPNGTAGRPGFLGSTAWSLLNNDAKVDGARFFSPNSGVLYPAIYDLLDRTQAAAKNLRPFRQLPQEGYRCSLCGEREWLTHDRTLLERSTGGRADSLWSKVQGTPWARKGEHLCAPCTLKRVWPSMVVQEARGQLEQGLERYVVSTHTMALATSLWSWLTQRAPSGMEPEVIALAGKARAFDRVSLPKKMADYLRKNNLPDTVRAIAERLPSYLDFLRESTDENLEDDSLSIHAREMAEVLGDRPETYYSLILMDGDRMGAWLSGQGPEGESYRLPYRESWHPQIRAGVAERVKRAGGVLASYPDERRPVSPARHMAISAALNSFALRFARHIVEEVGKGKLIYAGGDDLLAMVSVDDLLQVMFLLRLAYSGVFPANGTERDRALLGIASHPLDIGSGHIRLEGQLHRVMGRQATASMGAVVAHHQAPLGAVIRRLRAAEKQAKENGGRDAFSIALLKRSGGAVQLTSSWLPHPKGQAADWSTLGALEDTPMGQLIRLRDRFAGEGFSRRAAYLTQGWLEDMPSDDASLAAMLGFQFKRQTGGPDQDKKINETLGRRLAELAKKVSPDGWDAFIRDFLSVAEFLAREGRSAGPKKQGDDR